MTTITIHETERLVLDVLQESIRCGMREVCICPSARNAPFVQALIKIPQLKTYYWFEERSAAFFALGRTRETGLPTAVITTSGTAAGELLPAAMEAYYSGVPLILITADRPPSYRGTGAPQSAEQVGLFGVYALVDYDISANQKFSMSNWDQLGPAHINVCIDEPLTHSFDCVDLEFEREHTPFAPITGTLDAFFEDVKHPFVVVSTLAAEKRAEVVEFLVNLNAPVYLEGISGLRGCPRLRHLEICCPDKTWQRAAEAGYRIDGVLRIGGVPTFRSWRDLENMEGQLKIVSVNDVLLSGLSWGTVMRAKLEHPRRFDCPGEWLNSDKKWWEQTRHTFDQKPRAESSMVHALSKLIPQDALLYLGNSLPIREWDFAAARDRSDFEIRGNRGVNGIDGQISTFLGMCAKGRSNWGIFGDLTTLYDLAGPWILRALPNMDITIVVINNSGGQIFAKMFKEKELLNQHQVTFKPFANLWGMDYERWTDVPCQINTCQRPRLIEMIPE